LLVAAKRRQYPSKKIITSRKAKPIKKIAVLRMKESRTFGNKKSAELSLNVFKVLVYPTHE
jgi:hypothetical protein